MDYKVGDKIKYWGDGLLPTYGEVIAVTPKTAIVLNEYGQKVRLLKTKLCWD